MTSTLQANVQIVVALDMSSTLNKMGGHIALGLSVHFL